MPGLISSILSGLTDYGFQALSNSTLGMSKAQKEQNAYASSEASKARDFTAQQAEMNRDWQEEMYAKYDSLQGKIAQAREAGVNPMYAVTSSATSPMSASSPAVSSAVASPGSVSPVGRVSDMASAMMGFSKMSAEIGYLKAQTRNQNALALRGELESTWTNKLNEQTIKESERRIRSADVSDAEKAASTNLLISKVLTEEVTREEKAQNVLYLASEIELNSKEGEHLMSSIRQMDADIGYKAALTAGVLFQNGLNREYGARQMAADLRISEKEAQKMQREIKALEQEYGHNAVMNEYQRLISRQQAGVAYQWNDENYEGKPLRQSMIRIINGIERIVDLSASSVVVN